MTDLKISITPALHIRSRILRGSAGCCRRTRTPGSTSCTAKAIKEAACWTHARRKIHDVHVRTPSDTTTEALCRIGELYGIEAGIRGKSAAERLAIRQEKAVPLLTALEGWLREKQKTLSRHSELSKAFAYALNQWDALKLYLREITDTEHAGNVPPLTQ